MRVAVLALVLLPGCPPSQPNPEPTPTPAPDPVYFRSSFDATTVGPPVRVGNLWHQHLLGEGWETELPQREGQRNHLAYLTTSSPLSRYATAKVEDGALYMEVTADDPARSGLTRVEYGIYPPPDLRQNYVRYRLKLQPNIPVAWRVLMEWRETEPDFRWYVMVVKDRGRLIWRTIAQRGFQGNSPEVWREDSHLLVPVNEWFDLEVFWQSDREAGHLWAAVNGTSILDHHGQTSGGGVVHVWWPLKLYADAPSPIYQWIDDVAFGSERPGD